ncbi:hypothetical protein GFL58_29535 [Rhizobium leguminosarum bv. viciae]|uniref:hypothetical protein n=1 Tax=Rhizobium leguminosarum TaxID=384 RepID=UPI00143FAC45|nr:hypothetical protein [Rhizobium leguminosarum]NKM65071.1 hypothetical protein [Rhizobium leguminosarum bv. viciae]
MIKKIGIGVAIAAAWGIAWAAKEAFAIPDYAMWLGIIAVVGVLASFNIESRLSAIEELVIRKDYSGIIAQLEGERHKPQHKQPESLAAGGAIASRIRPQHESLFEDFRWFAALMNRHIADEWAIEELPTTDVRGYEGPEIGRMYDVWYNACEVGRMQVTLGAGALLSKEKERSARVELKLNYLRFIPYRDAHSLLYEIGLLTGSYDRTNGEAFRATAASAATDALTGYLWEAVRQPDLDPWFDFMAEGSYDVLHDQVEHWRKNGIDPMTRWGGDRDGAADN